VEPILKIGADLHDLDFADVKILKEAIDKAISKMLHQMRKVFELSRYEGLNILRLPVCSTRLSKQ